jgi:hypothetical protein
MCIYLCLVCNCCWLAVCIVVILCVSAVLCVLLFLLQMPDCRLEVSIRKVLRPATSTQVFLGFPVPISKRSDGSQHSKLPLHAIHVALRT